ncbi:hypothetical protein LguiA_024070 [Lonicera macranthoides]
MGFIFFFLEEFSSLYFEMVFFFEEWSFLLRGREKRSRGFGLEREKLIVVGCKNNALY